MSKQCQADDCQTYFTAKDKRQKYCSATCRNRQNKRKLRGQHVRVSPSVSVATSATERGDNEPPSYKKTSPLVPLAIPNGFLQCINCGEIVSQWETYHFDGEDYCPDCRDVLELNSSELSIEGNDILIVNEAQDKIWFVDAPQHLCDYLKNPVEGEWTGAMKLDSSTRGVLTFDGYVLSIETPQGHIGSVAITK